MRVRYILVLVMVLAVFGSIYYLTSRPAPAAPVPEKYYVWSVEDTQLKHMRISLPREGMSESFIKAEDRTWHFDTANMTGVDMQRWGGGIPLLLSGPGAERIIYKDATLQKLTEYGLTQPRMEITLTLENKDIIYIKVGDATPSGDAFYVQAPGTNDVAIVDISWYQVVERLVKEPPYPWLAKPS